MRARISPARNSARTRCVTPNQHLVSRGMAMLIVDALEMVDVEHDQRERRGVVACARSISISRQRMTWRRLNTFVSGSVRAPFPFDLLTQGVELPRHLTNKRFRQVGRRYGRRSGGQFSHPLGQFRRMAPAEFDGVGFVVCRGPLGVDLDVTHVAERAGATEQNATLVLDIEWRRAVHDGEPRSLSSETRQNAPMSAGAPRTM
jgi:hypothetical protein